MVLLHMTLYDTWKGRKSSIIHLKKLIHYVLDMFNELDKYHSIDGYELDVLKEEKK